MKRRMKEMRMIGEIEAPDTNTRPKKKTKDSAAVVPKDQTSRGKMREDGMTMGGMGRRERSRKRVCCCVVL